MRKPEDLILAPDRHLVLCGDIEYPTVQPLIASIVRLSLEDSTKPISLLICSPGGSIRTMWALIETMEAVTCPIATIGFSEISSAAAMILIAGTPSYRYLSANAEILFHPVNWNLEAEPDQLKQRLDDAGRWTERWYRYLSRRTQIEKKCSIPDFIRRQRYLRGEEAIEYGIADHILRKIVAKG